MARMKLLIGVGIAISLITIWMLTSGPMEQVGVICFEDFSCKEITMAEWLK